MGMNGGRLLTHRLIVAVLIVQGNGKDIRCEYNRTLSLRSLSVLTLLCLFSYFALTLLLLFSYSALTLLLLCSYSVITLLLLCSYFALTLL